MTDEKSNEQILDEMHFLDDNGKPLNTSLHQWVEWVPMKHKAPQNSNSYLVSDGLCVGYALYIDEWRRVNTPWENYTANVTHWMELPEPPKREFNNGTNRKNRSYC